MLEEKVDGGVWEGAGQDSATKEATLAEKVVDVNESVSWHLCVLCDLVGGQNGKMKICWTKTSTGGNRTSSSFLDSRDCQYLFILSCW
jgi:hypothetical protein